MTESVLETLPSVYRKFRDFVSGLARLLMQRNLFPATHPSVGKALDTVMEALEGLLGGEAHAVMIRRSGSVLCYLNFEIDTAEGNSNEIHVLRKALDLLAVDEMELVAGIERDELLAFVEIASAAIRRDRTVDLSAAWMRIRNIRIRRLPASASQPEEEPQPCVRVDRVRTIATNRIRSDDPGGISGLIGGVLRNLRKIDSLEGTNAGRTILEMIEREGRNNKMVLLLRSLKEYDEYTFDHSVNVAIISTAIARRLGYGEDEAGSVGMAALMHDMGKIYVPRDIIHKSGQLTPREWLSVKRHPIDGERILREEGADYLTRRVAYEHHMRFDRKGYPMPRDDEQCLEVSHIVRIADSYDALTTRRSYRKQISPFEAVRLMERGRGNEFHPGYFDVFLQVLGNIPIGSVLVLQGGEKVLVIEVGSEGRLPRVRLLTDADGNEPSEEVVLDLEALDPRTGGPRYRIASVLENPIREVDIRRYLVEHEDPAGA